MRAAAYVEGSTHVQYRLRVVMDDYTDPSILNMTDWSSDTSVINLSCTADMATHPTPEVYLTYKCNVSS